MPDCLGIDLGGRAVTLAVVSRSKAGLFIRAFERREYPADAQDPPARAAFAARVAAESDFSRLPIALSLPGTEVFLRPATVPFTKRAHIAKTLKFEMDGVLLFDVETAVMDFTVTAPAQEGTRLLVAAMPESAFAQVTAPFDEAGLKLRHVTADVLSAGALSRFTGVATYALLVADPASWKLSLCAGGRLLSARAAPAAPSADKMEKALGDWYKQSTMAAPVDIAPEKVFLTGELAGSLDLKAMSELIGVPVERVAFAPGAIDAAANGDDASTFGVAAVDAGAECCLGGGEFDFYAVARGRQGLLDRLFAPGAVGLLVLALVLGAFSWDSWHRMAAARESRAATKAAEAEIWKGLFADKPVPGGDVHTALVAAVDELQKSASADVRGGKSAPLFRALYVIAKTAPKEDKVTFTRFDARNGRVLVAATAASVTAGEALANAISADGTFKADLRNPRTDSGQWTFEIMMIPVRSSDAD